MANIFKRLLRGAAVPAIATRLTEPEAIELAKQAAGDHWLRKALNVATVERTTAGAVVWNVETSGIGSSLRIVIDDASGTVLDRIERNTR